MRHRETARLLLVAALAAASLVSACRRDKTGKYEFGEVKRGDIENIVSATGQMEPVGTVEVGTQVSGTVQRVLADFNSSVKQGQLLAVLDTVTLGAALRDAEAGMARAEAQWAQARADSARAQQLHARGLSSEQEMETARVSMAAARASLQSAASALDRAKANLAYAFVRSPITGKVISRNVDPGQTVAASLSAPTLFVIAEDLSRMRILAQVDEIDIGAIDSGLPVRFSVQAYPELEFTGTVSQVRLQPTVASGVVNYTVVVDAENPKEVLLPGMTATVDFVVEERRNVLTVPAAALSLRATEEMTAQLRREREAAEPKSSRRRPRPAEGDSARAAPRNETGSATGRLWYLDRDGRLAMMPVRTGATDGRNTEVTPTRDEIEEGTRVIIKAAGTVAQTQRARDRGFGPPMFGP